MFLEQYWGGPTTYSDQRGPPAAADAARAVRGDADRPRPLADPLPCGPRRGRPDRGAGRAVLGLRHARGPVHGQHARGAAVPVRLGSAGAPRLQPLALDRGHLARALGLGSKRPPPPRSPATTSVAVTELGPQGEGRLPRWPSHVCTSYAVRRCVDRIAVVDVGARHHVLAPVLSARGAGSSGTGSGIPGSTRRTVTSLTSPPSSRSARRTVSAYASPSGRDSTPSGRHAWGVAAVPVDQAHAPRRRPGGRGWSRRAGRRCASRRRPSAGRTSRARGSARPP